MENSDNPISEPTPGQLFLARSDVRDFLEERQIDPEDHSAIAALASLPRPLAGEYHNFFSLTKEDSLRMLASDLSRLPQDPNNDDRRQFLQTFHDLCHKYDWAACWHLNSLLEKKR